jgi:hypothetical protein
MSVAAGKGLIVLATGPHTMQNDGQFARYGHVEISGQIVYRRTNDTERLANVSGAKLVQVAAYSSGQKSLWCPGESYQEFGVRWQEKTRRNFYFGL